MDISSSLGQFGLFLLFHISIVFVHRFILSPSPLSKQEDQTRESIILDRNSFLFKNIRILFFLSFYLTLLIVLTRFFTSFFIRWFLIFSAAFLPFPAFFQTSVSNRITNQLYIYGLVYLYTYCNVICIGKWLNQIIINYLFWFCILVIHLPYSMLYKAMAIHISMLTANLAWTINSTSFAYDHY